MVTTMVTNMSESDLQTCHHITLAFEQGFKDIFKVIEQDAKLQGI
jgi:hypothetical protein